MVCQSYIRVLFYIVGQAFNIQAVKTLQGPSQSPVESTQSTALKTSYQLQLQPILSQPMFIILLMGTAGLVLERINSFGAKGPLFIVILKTQPSRILCHNADHIEHDCFHISLPTKLASRWQGPHLHLGP